MSLLTLLNQAGGGGGSGATPSGLAVSVALGTPTASIPATAPDGIAVTVGLGNPTVSIPSAAPNGIAVTVGLGNPTTTLNLTAAPDGIAVPVALGTPSVVTGVAGPSGIAVTVGLGNPTVALNLSAAPNGIAVPVALGTPLVVTGVAIPNGLGVTVGLGNPTTTLNLSATPNGFGITTGLGTPTVGATVPEVEQVGAKYEIEEIMDALATIFNGVATGDTIGGVPITISCDPDVVGEIDVPAIVLELDDQDFDISMGDGADSLTVIALALVQFADLAEAQRELWRFLSRRHTSGVARLKEALRNDQTLGGLVSYAWMQRVRSIGRVTYNGVDYLGAEIVIEVVS